MGIKNPITNATTNIVEVWPEGKEWKLESKLNKSKSKLLFSITTPGLGLPTTCLIICVKIPETNNETITKLLKINPKINPYLKFLKITQDY